MTLLLRLIDEHQAWASYPRPDEGDVSLTDIPLWAIREFMPTKRDNAGLSVFEVEDLAQSGIIAGGFAFSREKFEGGQYVFAAVPKKKITDAGIAVVDKPGNLNHSIADSKHREIVLKTLDEAAVVCGMFFNGEFRSIEGKIASAEARSSARLNHFDYMPLASLSLDKNWRAKNMMGFLKHGLVCVRGRPEPSAGLQKPGASK